MLPLHPMKSLSVFQSIGHSGCIPRQSSVGVAGSAGGEWTDIEIEITGGGNIQIVWVRASTRYLLNHMPCLGQLL